MESDGTATVATLNMEFPSSKYARDVPMPPLDGSLKGKAILYLVDSKDGKGLQWQSFNVNKAGQTVRADATVAELKAPVFKFTLVRGRKGGEIENVRLKKKHYGPTGKWIVAQKAQTAT